MTTPEDIAGRFGVPCDALAAMLADARRRHDAVSARRAARANARRLRRRLGRFATDCAELHPALRAAHDTVALELAEELRSPDGRRTRQVALHEFARVVKEFWDRYRPGERFGVSFMCDVAGRYYAPTNEPSRFLVECVRWLARGYKIKTIHTSMRRVQHRRRENGASPLDRPRWCAMTLCTTRAEATTPRPAES